MNLKTYLKQNKPLKVKQGKFTKAYLYENEVILKTNDPVKECMALGWFPESRLFPEVKFENSLETEDEFTVYKMERFETGRAVKAMLCKEDYEGLYLPLRQVFKNFFKSKQGNNIQFRELLEKTSLLEEIKEDLLWAFEACMNYSSNVFFEISPRNIAAKDGKLILLDCFFIEEGR